MANGKVNHSMEYGSRESLKHCGRRTNYYYYYCYYWVYDGASQHVCVHVEVRGQLCEAITLTVVPEDQTQDTDKYYTFQVMLQAQDNYLFVIIMSENNLARFLVNLKISILVISTQKSQISSRPREILAKHAP